MGVSALLVNCLPPDHVPGMLPWLRDFTDLPLGAYPNLGYYTEAGWRFDLHLGPAEYALLAKEWREEGAQIVGGCCGVTPEHIAAVRRALVGTKPGRSRGPGRGSAASLPTSRLVSRSAPEPWVDEHGRTLYPLPVPTLVCEPGVFVPTQGSFLVWKHLFRTKAGHGKRCLDVGCGSGILSVQLALNGAAHVHAIDIQREAVANTLANAFRNGVADRVSGEDVDLYTWLPEETYDLIVASLYQMPVDPFERASGHRPLDYWGRNLLDHLIGQLPRLLAEDGVAYIMQLSILSQIRTTELVDQAGLVARVVDFGFFPFTPVFQPHREQIQRVEKLSDAFHLMLGSEDVMIAYLLEVTRRDRHRAPSV
jgi:SAM-dependent methyltransferase